MALTDDLKAYWAMEDLTDSTGNGYTLSNNSATSGATGINNDCYDFNGSSSYVTTTAIPRTTTNGSYTVSFWIHFDSTANSQQMIGGATNFVGHIQTYQNTKLVFQWSPSYYVITNSGIVSNTGWYHIVIRYNDGDTGAQGRIFVNGNKITSYSASAYGSGSALASGTYYIGRYFASAGYYIDGQIDEIGMWTRGLSDDEVAELYNSGAGKFYPFSGGEEPVVYDSLFFGTNM